MDEDSGYRFYEPGQLGQARLIAALRQRQVPLAEIKAILPLTQVQAADRVREFWAATDAEHTARRALAAYLIDELSELRSLIEPALLSLRHRPSANQQTTRLTAG